MNKQLEEFVVCSCQTEGIFLKKYKGEQEVYLSVFTCGVNPKRMTLLTKLRYIWQVIKTGKPFDDQLVLGKAAINKLIVVLKKAVTK